MRLTIKEDKKQSHAKKTHPSKAHNWQNPGNNEGKLQEKALMEVYYAEINVSLCDCEDKTS